MKRRPSDPAFLVCHVVSFGLALAPWTSWAQSTSHAFLLSEPPIPAALGGIDREWNVSFRSGGKVRVVAAADLAYWGRYHEVEAGPQIILNDGGVIHADLLFLDAKQLVLGDATGLGRGFWEES